MSNRPEEEWELPETEEDRQKRLDKKKPRKRPGPPYPAEVVELVQAARAWDEYDGSRDHPRWIDIQHRLQAAYRQFSEPYADDAFCEDGGIRVPERTGPDPYLPGLGGLPPATVAAPVRPPQWDVETFEYPSGATEADQDDAYYKALKEGWEPFAVTSEPRPRVWLRRQA